MLKVLKKGCEPTKGSKYSAAIDLYSAEDVIIGAGETVKIPLGVCIDLDALMFNIKKHNDWVLAELHDFIEMHYLQLEPRSSLRAKGIQGNTGIIDLDFVPHCKISKMLNNGKCEHFKKRIKE